MIRFAGSNKDGRKMIGLGITSANLAKMAAGDPILVKTEDFDLTDIKMDIFIFYGRTLEELQEQLRPMISSETQVRDHTEGKPE